MNEEQGLKALDAWLVHVHVVSSLDSIVFAQPNGGIVTFSMTCESTGCVSSVLCMSATNEFIPSANGIHGESKTLWKLA